MHAMMALSASHLEKLAPSRLTVPAQQHRLAAIKGLNQALERPLRSTEEGDAAIATCYALLMQSWYMDDGLQASLVLTRSCYSTTKWVREQKVRSLLSGDDKCSRLKTMKGRLRGAPGFDTVFVGGAIEALDGLKPMCEEEFQTRLFGELRAAFESLAVSPVACSSLLPILFLAAANKPRLRRLRQNRHPHLASRSRRHASTPRHINRNQSAPARVPRSVAFGDEADLLSGEEGLHGLVLWDSDEWVDTGDLELCGRKGEEVLGVADVGVWVAWEGGVGGVEFGEVLMGRVGA